MTLQEILNAHKGHEEKELNKWRRVRWLGTAIYNAPRGEKDPVVKPTDLLKLPGDEDVIDIDAEREKIKEYRQHIKDGGS